MQHESLITGFTIQDITDKLTAEEIRIFSTFLDMLAKEIVPDADLATLAETKSTVMRLFAKGLLGIYIDEDS